MVHQSAPLYVIIVTHIPLIDLLIVNQLHVGLLHVSHAWMLQDPIHLSVSCHTTIFLQVVEVVHVVPSHV